MNIKKKKIKIMNEIYKLKIGNAEAKLAKIEKPTEFEMEVGVLLAELYNFINHSK